MNRFNFPFLCCFALLVMLTISSCGGDDEIMEPEPEPMIENAASFRIGGRVYTYSEFFFNTTAEYDEAKDVTMVSAGGASDTNGVFFQFFFPGNEPNLFLYRGDIGAGEEFVPIPGEQDFFIQIDDNQYFINGVTLQIDTYGEVGELITGTFFGQWEDFLGEGISVSSGTFEIIRTK